MAVEVVASIETYEDEWCHNLTSGLNMHYNRHDTDHNHIKHISETPANIMQNETTV